MGRMLRLAKPIPRVVRAERTAAQSFPAFGHLLNSLAIPSHRLADCCTE